MEKFSSCSQVLGDGTVVESSILYLARFDAWIPTVAKCLSIPDGRGGQRQGIFSKYYHSFLTFAVQQILGKVCDVVREMYPDELKLDWNCDIPVLSTESETRVATVVVKIPSTKKLYIAARSDWFSKNVSAILGEVLDCYIAEAPVGGGDLTEMGQREETGVRLREIDDSEE